MLKGGLHINTEIIISILKYLLAVMGGIIMIGPFYWMVTGSFKTLVEATRIPPTFFPQELTLKNFKLIFSLLPFHRYLLNSVFVSTATTSLKIFSSVLGGYIFAKFYFRGKNLLFYLFLAGLMIPFQMIIIPMYVLIVNLGWGNTLTALIVPGYCEVFALFLARQFMHSIPNDLIDAARIDGASEFTIFFKIIFPLCTALIIPLFILLFLQKWNSLLWPLVVLTTQEKFTLSLGLANLTQSEFHSELTMSLAAAVVAMLPILAIFSVMQKQIKEGIVLTGIK